MLKRGYFNELAPRWDSLPALPGAEEKVARFVRRAVETEDRRVLDVGAGTGILLPHLLAASVPCIVELDFAERMLEAGRAKAGGGRVEPVCGDACRLPLRPGSFDAVLCFGVLPHLGPAGDALAGLLPAARPGGTLAVGHLLGSSELNAFHSAMSGPVAGDSLRPARETAAILQSLGAAVLACEEEPGWYFVRVRR